MEGWKDAEPVVVKQQKMRKIEAGVKLLAGSSSTPTKAVALAIWHKPKLKRAKENIPDPDVEYGDLMRSSQTMAGCISQSKD